MTHTTSHTHADQKAVVLLLNLDDNDEGMRIQAEVNRQWRSEVVAGDWPGRSGLNTSLTDVVALLVFTRLYEENAALRVCEDLRKKKELDGIPLLVAINMYQMPLGNSVKRLPAARFVFTPLKADDLAAKINDITMKEADQRVT